MACLRVPLEFCHNQKISLFIDMFLAFLLTLSKVLCASAPLCDMPMQFMQKYEKNLHGNPPCR